jgi:hypothetical protein
MDEPLHLSTLNLLVNWDKSKTETNDNSRKAEKALKSPETKSQRTCHIQDLIQQTTNAT